MPSAKCVLYCTRSHHQQENESVVRRSCTEALRSKRRRRKQIKSPSTGTQDDSGGEKSADEVGADSNDDHSGPSAPASPRHQSANPPRPTNLLVPENEDCDTVCSGDEAGRRPAGSAALKKKKKKKKPRRASMTKLTEPVGSVTPSTPQASKSKVALASEWNKKDAPVPFEMQKIQVPQHLEKSCKPGVGGGKMCRSHMVYLYLLMCVWA